MKVYFEASLPTELVQYVQMLDYEVGGMSHIVERILQNGRTKQSALLDRYDEQYRNAFARKELALLEVSSQYVPEEFRNTRYAIAVNFHRQTVQVLEDPRYTPCKRREETQ